MYFILMLKEFGLIFMKIILTIEGWSREYWERWTDWKVCAPCLLSQNQSFFCFLPCLIMPKKIKSIPEVLICLTSAASRLFMVVLPWGKSAYLKFSYICITVLTFPKRKNDCAYSKIKCLCSSRWFAIQIKRKLG